MTCALRERGTQRKITPQQTRHHVVVSRRINAAVVFGLAVVYLGLCFDVFTNLLTHLLGSFWDFILMFGKFSLKNSKDPFFVENSFTHR